MRMLPKNVARFDGSVRLDGRELIALPDDQFRREIRWSRIAMVFQGAMSVLNPVLRIGEQIAEPLLLDRRFDKTAARARVRDLLERVGLPADFASRYPHELSGGQRQRVGIATALALDPDVLILDEPTSALDVSVQAQIMNLLKDLKEDPGISMLFITHDIGLASDLCDRIAVTYAGEQMELGSRRAGAGHAAPSVLPAPAGLVATPSFRCATPSHARRPARPHRAPGGVSLSSPLSLRLRGMSQPPTPDPIAGWWACPLLAERPGRRRGALRNATPPGGGRS